MFCSSEYSALAENAHHTLLPFEGIHKNDLGLLPAAANAMIKNSLHSSDDLSTGLEHMASSPAGLLAAAGSLSSMHTTNFDASFVRERDFQRLLPDADELDTFDPKNESVMSIIRAADADNTNLYRDRDLFRLYGEQYAVVFQENGAPGAGYSNFMKFTSSNRMKLLMLREYKPFLFTGMKCSLIDAGYYCLIFVAPIPLSEAEIKQSELYRNLLNTIPEDKVPTNTVLGVAPLGEGLGATMKSGLGQTSKFSVDNLMREEEEDSAPIDPLLESLMGHSNTNKISNFMDRIRDIHMNMERGSGGAKHAALCTSDLVAETDYTFQFEFFELEKIIPDRIRALKPTPKVRTPQATQVNSCNLLVQVVGCKNVPLRVQVRVVFYCMHCSGFYVYILGRSSGRAKEAN